MSSTKDAPFSMRLSDPDRTWLKLQSKSCQTPMTKIISRCIEHFQYTGFPQKLLLYANSTLTGDTWEASFSGLVRVQIASEQSPVRAVDIQVTNQTFSELETMLKGMLTG